MASLSMFIPHHPDPTKAVLYFLPALAFSKGTALMPSAALVDDLRKFLRSRFIDIQKSPFEQTGK